jgi:U2 small nuclear ribonucleoprotein B''
MRTRHIGKSRNVSCARHTAHGVLLTLDFLEQKEVAEAKEAKNNPQAAAIEKPRPKTGAQAVPSEYVPPNRTIVLDGLPADVTQETIADIYSNYEGYKETRFVPFKRIAFVEFVDETTAIPAKESTTNMLLGKEQKPVKVTYQRA